MCPTAKEYRIDVSDIKNNGKCSYSSAADGSYYNLPENHWGRMTVSITSSGGQRAPQVLRDLQRLLMPACRPQPSAPDTGLPHPVLILCRITA